jgi:hypothetical protein
MTDEQKRYALRAIDPIAPAPDADEVEEQQDRADRVGFVATAAAGSTPAVGIAAERMNDEPMASDEGARGETEADEVARQPR